MRTLEEVLADWRGDAAVLRRQGHEVQASLLERLASEASEAAHEFVSWLTEGEAQLRSGRSPAWLRRQFPEWERAGHAKREKRVKLYRMLIVPRRANLESAREAGRRAGQRVA